MAGTVDMAAAPASSIAVHPNGLRQHRPKTSCPGLSGASHLGVWSAKTGYSWCVCDLFICERMERRCRACGLALGDCSDAKPPRVGAGGFGSLGQWAGSVHLPRALGCPQRCVVAVPHARGTAGDCCARRGQRPRAHSVVLCCRNAEERVLLPIKCTEHHVRGSASSVAGEGLSALARWHGGDVSPAWWHGAWWGGDRRRECRK